VLLCESTYGDRAHAPPGAAEEHLARIVREGAARGGAILVPAFALGRTQELLWLLQELEEAKRIPSLPVYVDSPLAIEVTGLYGRHPEDHDAEMGERVRFNGSAWHGKRVRLVHSSGESKALNRVRGPVIIISASGMATGGRILHHLTQRLPDPRTTVLLVGFQAAGTRGRALKEGPRRSDVRQQCPCGRWWNASTRCRRAARTRSCAGWTGSSGHRAHLPGARRAAAEALEGLIRARGWTVRAARDTETVPLTAEA
jgi:metallo-beta-lactamase family protein